MRAFILCIAALATLGNGHGSGGGVAAIFGVIAPTVIAALAVLWPRPRLKNFHSRRSMMLKWFIKRKLHQFGAAFDYDVGYMLDLVETDLAAGKAIGALQNATNYRANVPLAAYSAAQIAATMHEDCGPCVQLGVRIAEKSGVAQNDLRAVITGDVARMSADASLGYRFAKAALARDETLDDVREEVVRRWGKKGLGAISIGMMTVRAYPAIKYALGHGQACQSVEIGGILTAAHKGTPVYAE